MIGLAGLLLQSIEEPVPVRLPVASQTADKSAAPSPMLTESSWAFEYDDAGRKSKIVNPAGQVTMIRYSEDSRKQVREVVQDPPDHAIVRIKFDADGRRTVMTDALGEVIYKYDGLGRLTQVRRGNDPAIAYSYDSVDRMTSLSVGDELVVNYGYDFLGRLESIDIPAGCIAFEYSANKGTVQRTLPNGVRTVWQYAPGGELESIKHIGGDGQRLASFEYKYRPDGLIAEISESFADGATRIAYQYDCVKRLVGVTDPRGRSAAFQYDELGNRRQVEYEGKTLSSSAYDWAGRLVRHNGEPCLHDEAGNLIDYSSRQGKISLTHSAEGRLLSARMEKNSVQYSYDGDGNLVSRIANGQAKKFVPDPLAETWRPLLSADAVGRRVAYLWLGNTPLAVKVDGEWRFFLHNHQDSVRYVTDRSGRVVDRFDYDAFGTPSRELATDDFQPAFVGLFYDRLTSLYLTRARAYDPALGRFLQCDPQHRVPLGSQKDLSIYAYCGADPVNFRDIDGAQPFGPGNLNDSLNRLNRIAQPQIPPFPAVTLHAVNPLFQHYVDRALQTVGREAFGVQSLFPRRGELFNAPTGIPFVPMPNISYANWGGWDRAPLENRAAPRAPLDSVDRAFRHHDIALAHLRQHHPGTGFLSLSIPQVGQIHRNLANELRRSVTAPDATLAGRASAMAAWPLFRGMAAVSADLSNRRGMPNTTNPVHLTRSGALPPPPPPGGGANMLPSRVGGVHLGGAGARLQGLENLEGVATDGNGRIVLVGQELAPAKLPSLRLDDVVTIFRSVYDQGDAPWVSIDPDPDDPVGQTMIVRHSPGTEGTYVGWILFEADRVMKTYSLGQDNLTGAEFHSSIGGYDKHLSLRFSDSTKGRRPQGRWERYWIVPSEVAQLSSADGRTSLLKVPLKLRTEAMIMRDGKLVSDSQRKSSPRAEYFTKWFTEHYAEIAAEARSLPPAENGMNTPIPIFAELQRVAVVCAVAERLRDQGASMPGWMRDYPVKPFVLPTTTPATRVVAERRSGNELYQISIYGGVSLSPPADSLHVVPAAPKAEAVAPLIRHAVAAAPALTCVPFEQGDSHYRAIALPADNALAVGANRLEETDLEIALDEEHSVNLLRQFDSFHEPTDVFGSSWTLNMPRLNKRPGPPAVEPGMRKVYYELTTPLDTRRHTFTEVKYVAEVGSRLLIPSSHCDILGLADSQELDFTTRLVLFRDGGKWHFDESGNLVAADKLPFQLRYQYDHANRLVRMEGNVGKRLASLGLEYDQQGRLLKASGSDGAAVQYAYDANGQLLRVASREDEVEYEYTRSWVSRIARRDQRPRRFEYAAGGRLLKEQRSDGVEIAYDFAASSEGTRVTARSELQDRPSVSCEYDAAFRPLRRTDENGSQMQWFYRDGGETEITVTSDNRHWTIIQSSDGSREEYRIPGIESQTALYDDAGRLKQATQGERLVLKQEWRFDGLLAKATDETTATEFAYGDNGLPQACRLTPIHSSSDKMRGLEIEFDENGRPASIRNESDAAMTLKYDDRGNASEVTAERGKVTTTYDANDRLESVITTWGNEERRSYDAADGFLRQLAITREGGAASIDFDRGQTRRIRQFDGGEFLIDYDAGSQQAAQPCQIRTPSLMLLTFDYDARQRVRRLRIGNSYALEYSFDDHDRLTRLRQVPVVP